MDESFDVVVVGAGLAGLAAGATAALGASTLILDGHHQGGRASTDKRGRYRFNRGPHALYRGGEATAVLARLGVSTPGAVPPASGARGRIGDRVDVLPATAATLLRSRLLSVRGKFALIRFLSGVKKWRPGDVAGLTVGQWLDTFKLPEDARKVALFLVRTTTYTNDEDTLSADVAAGQIQMALVNNVLYLDNGWGSMVDSLAATARRNGAEIRTGAAVTSIKRSSSDGDLTVTLSGGQEIQAGAVVLAAGTPGAAATLLGNRPAAWADLGPEVEASVLDLGLRQGLEHPILFGIDPPMYLVDHARSAKHLAPEGGGLVHVLHYLPLGDQTPAGELRSGLEEHARMAGVDSPNVEEQRFLLRMTVVGAVPTPASGGLAGRPAIDSTGVPGVFVAGDWVGPRGWLADASLSSGEAAGQAAARDAARRADGVRPLPSRQDVA
ncbi:MAG: phytoene desaturase family protein [Acidimicrobiia bacterium]